MVQTSVMIATLPGIEHIYQGMDGVHKAEIRRDIK
jgi:hypothetical protein